MKPGMLPSRGQINLNFDDADIYTIIQTIFGDILKTNYVVDPRIKGRVTFRSVAPVPHENVLPLMEVILRLNGIGIIEESGLYRIIPISDISKEPSPVRSGRDPAEINITGKALLQVVPIQFVQSSEVIQLIQPFVTASAVLVDIPKGNQIIIADTDANVKRLLELIQIFDHEQLKRRPQIFVYNVQNGKAKDVATLLQQIFLGAKPFSGVSPTRPATSGYHGNATAQTPATSSQPQISSVSTGIEPIVSDAAKIIPDEITNTIIVLCTPEEYEIIKKTIEQIDIVPRQVVIEGMIASVNLIDNLSLGMAALFKTNIFNMDAGISLNPSALNVDPMKLSQKGFTFLGTDSNGQVRALITAMATDSKAKLLATPHVLVSDNREARIQVGQQVPLVTSETYGSTVVAPQRNIQYKDIGIILKVKPRVNEGGLVSLEISQEVSTYETITLFVDEKQIILDKTDVATTLVVQDGQTIVIGGLIREDNSRSRSGVPFLSKVPLLGWLFGTTEDESKRQEIIILLTPHVIKNQKEAKSISTDYIDRMSETSQGRIKKDELIKKKQPKEGGIVPGKIDPEAAHKKN